MKNLNSKTNKIIIRSAGIILAIIGFICILFNCSISDDIGFHYYENPETRESLSVAASILVYVFLWAISGIIPSACVMLFMMMVYFFLHREDKNIFKRGYHPPYEEESNVIVTTAIIATYSTSIILFLLYMFGVITVGQ